jgi:hypothetical protein
MTATHQIRQKSPGMPIVAMTGFRFRPAIKADLDFLTLAVARGATSCVRKSFPPVQLIEAINESMSAALSGNGLSQCLCWIQKLPSPNDEYSAVKGLPADWTPLFIRTGVTQQMDEAETYIMSAPVAVVGILSADTDGTPVEVTSKTIKAAILRKATEEPDVMPMPVEFSTTPWSGG